MMRMICQHMREGSYEGEATIYAHDEVIALLRDLAGKLLQKKLEGAHHSTFFLVMPKAMLTKHTA